MLCHITIPLQFEAALRLNTEASTTPRFSRGHISDFQTGNLSSLQHLVRQHPTESEDSESKLPSSQPFPEKAFQ
jgi:hypothetical protein